MPVMTVLGPIPAKELGIVAPHEHCFIDLRNQFRAPATASKRRLALEKVDIENIDVLKRNPLALKDNLLIDDTAIAKQEIARFRKAGGNTIVDATSIGLGRKPAALKALAKATGVHIVAGCGYYYHDTHPKEMGRKSATDIAQEMIDDIEKGIDGTGVRAGVIGEIGISPRMHPDEKKVLAAAARAQARTGAGIQVHIFPWTKAGRMPLGLVALDILEDNGADLRRVAIGHVDVASSINLAYCKAIARRGAFLEFDNFGHEFYVDKQDRLFIPGPFATDVQRLAALKALIASGYASHILISTDICHKNLLHAYGGWGYDHILEHIVPMMRELGIAHHEISAMLRDNPRRLLDTGEAH